MYILCQTTIDALTETATQISFQPKAEDGTNIGTVQEFSLEAFFVDNKLPFHLGIQKNGTPQGVFPPYAGYPTDRLLFETVFINVAPVPVAPGEPTPAV